MTSKAPQPRDGIVTIAGMPDLLAVHKTIMEAKFHENPGSTDILGSPILARIANEVVDAMITTERQAGHDARAADWAAFRKLSSRRWVVDSVRRQVSRNPNWANWDNDFRDTYLRNALAPFVPTNAEVAALREQIEENR